ncbi:hypothetical protein AXG93_2727s1130 [Marchantia polymorpha subsp. ruderalis]|uniref:Uncharacterized protein n=1 Tax=Marchantia polymorpha subsp. ruderalis TaxID=1480154 RepID=A0A176VCQ1_MARPO|nr:hypothetical protein AXG93_2727s1130 [Marchantia polymorpha subsp. ruderalis]
MEGVTIKGEEEKRRSVVAQWCRESGRQRTGGGTRKAEQGRARRWIVGAVGHAAGAVVIVVPCSATFDFRCLYCCALDDSASARPYPLIAQVLAYDQLCEKWLP